MWTAMLAVRNVLGERHDLWSVNAEADYLESAVRGERPGGERDLLELHQRPRPEA